MQEVIRNYLEQARVGRKRSYRNFAVFQILSPYAATVDYIMLDEALDEELIEVVEKEDSSLQKYVNHFRLAEMQLGAVFAINGKVVGLDSFAKPETFSKVFKKLVQSYALDAIDWFNPDKEFKVLKGDVTKFLKAAAKAKVESRPSVGKGTDCRMESKDIAGFALALDDQLLHLSMFAGGDEGGRNRHRSRIERFSNRRRRSR